VKKSEKGARGTKSQGSGRKEIIRELTPEKSAFRELSPEQIRDQGAGASLYPIPTH
jgi:hypothetical protein